MITRGPTLPRADNPPPPKQSDERKWEAVASDLLVTFSFLFARHRIHPDRATDASILKSARGKVCSQVLIWWSKRPLVASNYLVQLLVITCNYLAQLLVVTQ